MTRLPPRKVRGGRRPLRLHSPAPQARSKMGHERDGERARGAADSRRVAEDAGARRRGLAVGHARTSRITMIAALGIALIPENDVPRTLAARSTRP